MKDNGGPAFPRTSYAAPGAQLEPAERAGLMHDGDPGMTLRDYFAAKAMQSMTAGPGARMVADRDQRYDETNWSEIVALNAYEMADAMLKARAS